MQKQIMEKVLLVSLFSVMTLIGFIGLQTSAKAALIDASQVVGQMDINSQPSFTQGNQNSSLINDYGFNNPGAMVIDEINHRMFVADTGNNRVLVFNLGAGNKPKDFNADYVLGQANFTSGLINGDGNSFGSVNAHSFNKPRALAFDSVRNLLFVSDQNNNRVLIFDVSTIDNNEDAVSVFGQTNFTNHGAGVSEDTLAFPTALAVHDGGRTLFVADSYNNRVLAVDVSDVTKIKRAFAVLGQSDFTSSASGLSAANLYNPISLSLQNNLLFVLDQYNNRVLAFDISTIDNGENAVNVLGQADFDTAENNSVAANRLSSPVSLLVADNKLFVAQSHWQRIAIFDISTIEDGEPAVSVLGEINFDTSFFIFLPVNRSSFNFGFNGGMAYLPSDNKLYVVDDDNNRILTFDITTIIDGEPATSVIGQIDAQGN